MPGSPAGGLPAKKEFDLLLNILIGGMLGNQENTFFIKFRVCDSPLWTTYKVFSIFARVRVVLIQCWH